MKKILPFFVIFFACAVFFYPTISKGLLPVPADTLIGLYHPWRDQAATTNPVGVPFKNFLITDPIRQLIPWRKLVIDGWKKVSIPSWNPYNFSGATLRGNIQAGVWYPLNILFFFLPFSVAWALVIMVQPVLAALFLYVYLRNKQIPPWVSVFGGLVWAFCGFAIAWLTWGTILQTAVWLPLLLLAIDNSWPVLLVVSSVGALFAGHAQVALYILLFAGAYGFRKFSRQLIAAAACAVVISSVQWVPMAQLVMHSSRLTDAGAWLKDGWFLPWQHLVQFVAPDFFGNPATLNYFGVWNYGEFVGYIGILPLMFALYAVITRRDRLTRFYAVAAGIIFLFLLPTPLAALPYRLHIPVLFSLQPTRLMVLVDFCFAVLAALGLDAYVRKSDNKIIFTILAVAILLGALWIYATGANLEVSRHNLILPSILFGLSIGILLVRKWKHIFLVCVISLTIFDLFRFGWKFTPFTPPEYFFPTTKAVAFLQSQHKPFRVMSLDNRIMPPNVGAYYGIESIEGYDPLYDARYEEFIAALNRREPNSTPPFGFNRIVTTPTIDSPLLPLLNVTYVLALEDVRSPDLELMYREGNTRIYFYTKALPRIYPTESVKVGNNRQDVMNLLYDKNFYPEKTAIVEEQIPNIHAPIVSTDSIKIVSYEDSSLRATASLASDHFVIIANMFDKNWKATVDGKRTKIYRADYLFIGLLVPKGDHLITLAYE